MNSLLSWPPPPPQWVRQTRRKESTFRKRPDVGGCLRNTIVSSEIQPPFLAAWTGPGPNAAAAWQLLWKEVIEMTHPGRVPSLWPTAPRPRPPPPPPPNQPAFFSRVVYSDFCMGNAVLAQDLCHVGKQELNLHAVILQNVFNPSPFLAKMARFSPVLMGYAVSVRGRDGAERLFFKRLLVRRLQNCMLSILIPMALTSPLPPPQLFLEVFSFKYKCHVNSVFL